MIQHEREKLLYRILSGKTILRNLRLDVLAPSLDLLYESEEIYSEYYNKGGILTKERLKEILVQDNIISYQDLNFIDKSQDIIENFQKELCANFYNNNAQEIRSLLKQTREKYSEIISRLTRYETYSKEGLASYAKSIFIIRNTTYRNGKVYDFFDRQPVVVLEALNSMIIPNSDIRSVVKRSSWSNIWFSMKSCNIFTSVPTIEQQLLLMWSRIYDGIRESQEAPSEDLIQDDDAIDGWLLIEKAKNNEARAKNTRNLRVNSKINNADEVFIIAKNKEDIDRINKMNGSHASRVKEERISQIYEKGSVNYHNFLDVRRDIQSKYHQMQVDRIKGK